MPATLAGAAMHPATDHVDISCQGDLYATSVESCSGIGAAMMVKGFFLNNTLTDFLADPVSWDGKPVANAPAPASARSSAMSPTIFFEQGRIPSVPGIRPGGPAISTCPQALVAMLEAA